MKATYEVRFVHYDGRLVASLNSDFPPPVPLVGHWIMVDNFKFEVKSVAWDMSPEKVVITAHVR